ncbi:hypothetical protein EKG37_17960 [Robertmurraya yapensis]|uniref:Uncharacterized protein n=2 Tax=Bacillaceae TaxID=186817 RepID=A0A3S0KD92_9BACI|nr:hypothetical protein EKG37_17960 [Bacillus yapensis]TKC15116.1 hypothetical protein FA727_19700 [Robertmurraya kyonggiensis]TKS94430.1 hypothetical protein FAR12_17970 [Bacillus yapensis]
MYRTPTFEQLFKLDSYFNYMNDVMKNHPKIQILLKQYEEKFHFLADDFLKNLSIEKEFEDLKNNKQRYQRIIHLPNNSFMNLTWYIPEAIRIVEKNKIKTEMREISQLNIDYDELHFDYLPVAITNKKPIILITYEAFRYFSPEFFHFIIDGSHRAAAKDFQARKKGINNPLIKSVILDSNQTMEAMFHNVHRLLYKMHSNLNHLKFLYEKGLSIESDEVLADLYSI